MAKIVVGLRSEFLPASILAAVKTLFGQVDEHLFHAVGLKQWDKMPAAKSKELSGVEDSLLADNPEGMFALELEQTAEAEHLLNSGIQSVSLAEVARKSIFADLMILHYESFVDQGGEDRHLLSEVLKNSKCPVLLVPDHIEDFDHFILTYDGKESSVFAIKNFYQLFGEAVKEKPVSILTVIPEDEQEIRSEKDLLELVQQHFEDVGLQVLQGEDIAGEIIRFSACTESPVVVMGAFGRSSISNLLLPSVAGQIIERKKLPLFIVHH